jgi:uncharacterized cupredoxin-like copper-binding protein
MTHDRKATFRSARLAAAALALGIFTSAGIAGVSAQDATPEASPATVACVSPGLPPGTPTPMDDMSGMDMGSPAAEEPMEMDMGSPEAVEEAPAAVGAAADEATSASVIAVLENYVACYNEGQASGDPGLYVALESMNYVQSEGNATRYDRAASELGSPFATASLLDADNVQTWDDGRVSVDAQLLVGEYWLNHWQIFFVQGEDGTWLYDEQINLPAQPDADFVAVNGINITETKDESTGEITYAFVSYSGSWDFPQTEAIVFNFMNSGEEVHEAILAKLPEGADPMGILDGSIDFSQVEFIGVAVPILPGTSVDLTVLNLPVGTYTLICFIPGPDGAPHAAHGMIQQLNIVAPAS